MINNMLGFVKSGGIEWIIILIMFTVFAVLPICLIVWLVKSILRANKERQKARMEISKMADELEKIRKQGD